MTRPTTLLKAFAALIAGASLAHAEITGTMAQGVDTAEERLAWQQAIGSDFEGKDANFTAEVNGRYVATATLEVTDPVSALAGDSFVVYVRAGTATVGGTAYATAGTMIVRAYAGGAWASKVFTPDDAVAITGGTATLSSATITGDLTVDTTTLKVDSTADKVGLRLTTPKGVLSIGDGEASSVYTIPHLAFEFAGGGYANAIHSRHDGAGLLNSLDFFTSDGTQNGTFPANYVHGMSVQNGKVGIGTGVYNPTTALTIGNSGTISFTANSGTWNGATIAGDQTMSGNLSVSQDIAIRGAEIGNASLTVHPQAAAYRGITIKTPASQTAQTLYIEDSSGNARAGFDNVGNYFVYAANNVQGLYMADQSAPGGTEKRASFTLRGGSSQYLAINPGRDGSNNAGDLLLAYDLGNVAIGNVIPTSKLTIGDSGAISFEANSGTWDGATISGDQTMSGKVTLSTMPKVSAYKSSDQNGLTTGAYNKITFDTEEWDVGSNFASSTFTAPYSCKVMVTFSIFFNGTAGADAVAIYKNGAVHRRVFTQTTSAEHIATGTAVIDCAASDTIEIYAYPQNARNVYGAQSTTFVQITAIP